MKAWYSLGLTLLLIGHHALAQSGSATSAAADDVLELRAASVDCVPRAIASSVQKNRMDYAPARAVDGQMNTRWSSEKSDHEYLQIDLGASMPVEGATIFWEDAYASGYRVMLSADGKSFTEVFATDEGDGGEDKINWPRQNARYVRIVCSKRATGHGYSIWEVALQPKPECRPNQRSIDMQIEQLLADMTLEEKTSLVHGETSMSLRPIARLGIPALLLADGPLGIRHGTATAFPAPICLASTWDTRLAHRFGEAIAREFHGKGRHVWLGPGMNIIRVPQCGRNFEYYSEDPFLAARMAVATITGAQSQGVIACAKHFAANNQEHERTKVNVEVDERTLRELYLPAFEASVKEAGVLSVMSAYNRLNGPYCTANHHIQTEILKDEWGFNGFVVSDWGAVHETAATANAGCDLEMDGSDPTGDHWGKGQLHRAVKAGEVSEERVDDMVRRILRAHAFVGLLDGTDGGESPNAAIQAKLVREIAARGAVLLKNDNRTLPLDKSGEMTIAVVGSCYNQARTGGGGSSRVDPPYTVSPLKGLKNVAGPGITFVDAPGVALVNDAAPAPASFLSPPEGNSPGLLGAYFGNRNLEGEAAFTRVDQTIDFRWSDNAPGEGVGKNDFSVRWTGTLTVPETGEWSIGMATDDGFRLYLDGELLIDDWHDHGREVTVMSVQLKAGESHALELHYYEAGGSAEATFICQKHEGPERAIAAAKSADAALVFVGLSPSQESEGFDRPTIDLSADELNLIQQVAKVNPRTIVVIVAGSQMGFDAWLDDVPAVLHAWYGGQEGGNAIADVLFGDVNPSGKLPMTFVRKWADHPLHEAYPDGKYNDKLNVGYRYFDQADVKPAFPFGHGLSYTSFAYTDLTIDDERLAEDGTVMVTFKIKNTGQRPGRETAQVYVRDVKSSVARPAKELKGFATTSLGVGEAMTLSVELTPRSFAWYDVNAKAWRVEEGAFEILVGASSTDIRLHGEVFVPGGLLP